VKLNIILDINPMNIRKYQDSDDPDYTIVDGREVHLVETIPTEDHVANTDGYGRWTKVVFAVDGVTYMTWAAFPSEEWRDRSGEAWDDYFPSQHHQFPDHAFADRYVRVEDGLKCCRAEQRPVTVYQWQPADDVDGLCVANQAP